MKRDFRSVVRLMLPVVFACVVLAIAARMLGASSSAPAWAALRDSKTSPYSNVIIVARAGGDFTSVQAALNSITNNSPTNPYLVWVAPGIYTETVTMKQYVDIEGAGEKVTKIVNTGSVNSATLFGASNAELRYLTVESNSSAWMTAIRNVNASPSLLHVTAITRPTSGDATPTPPPSSSSPTIWQFYGIRNMSGSSPTMTDVTVSVDCGYYSLCYGVANEGNSSPTMRNVTISGISSAIISYGVYNDNSSATMKDVTISGYQYGVWNHYGPYPRSLSVVIDTSTVRASYDTIYSAPDYVTLVGASKLEGGPVIPNGGPVTCAGVYDENYTFFPNTCP